MATMKALQLTRSKPSDPITVTYTTVPAPTPQEGHLLVRIAASAFNPSDRLNATGGFASTTFPRVPGRDFSGTVVAGPPDRVGEAVFGSGGGLLGFTADGPHAELCLVPAALALPKPAALSHEAAAAVGVPYLTAHLAITRARVAAADAVLVVGATGNVGGAAVQILRAMGCKTVLTASRHDDTDVNIVADPQFDKVKELTGSKGVDVIINTVGDQVLMKAAFNALGQSGRYAFIASGGGVGSSNAIDIEVRPFYRNEFELIGCNSGNMREEEIAASLKILAEWLESGALMPKAPNKDAMVSLEDVAKDYQTGKTGRMIVMQ